MGRADGRVQPGQRLDSAFSARAWNRAQDAADIVLAAQRGVEAGQSDHFDRSPSLVLIRNNTGQSVPRFGVLGITGVVIDPTGGTLEGTDQASNRARQFARRPVLAGSTPNSTRDKETFAVLVEPASPGSIVRAAVSGSFACRVQVINTAHRFATVKHNDFTQLQSTDCGVLQLLWTESGAGQMKWAVGVM